LDLVLEELKIARLINTTRKVIPGFTENFSGPNTDHTNTVLILAQNVCNIYFRATLPYLSIGLFLSHFPTKILYSFLMSLIRDTFGEEKEYLWFISGTVMISDCTFK